LVLMDVSLRATQWQGRPIDGIELARLLKQRTPTRLPVILATAHAMTGDRERLLAASGADAYLQKPVYDARELVEMVQQLISQP
jgi:CheY-like chemotaxis protein